MAETEDKRINVNADNTVKYLQLFNGMFDLTDMELRVLAAFIDVHDRVKEAGLEVPPFSTEMRKQVAKDMGRDDFTTLNNYIKKLADKQAIERHDKGYSIHPFLKPMGEDRIVFVLTNGKTQQP